MSHQKSCFPVFFFSSRYRSDDPVDIIATFPRINGTIILMGAPVRGSYKFYEQIGVFQQPYHGATSGEYQSGVVIGAIDADDCKGAYDELYRSILDPTLSSEFILTNTRLTEILEEWDRKAPNSTEINKFYKDETKLKYQARGIYKSDNKGYVYIGIASNLVWQFNKLMKEKISANYLEENKVEVFAPELERLLEISMDRPRIHFYPAGTGAMGAHHDSFANSYDDIRQQKYSISFDLKDYKNK